MLALSALFIALPTPYSRVHTHGGFATPPVRRVAASPVSRRALLGGAFACPCCLISPGAADALAALVTPNSKDLQAFDVPRDARRDSGFAMGMATGMADYEVAAAPRKRVLFGNLLASLPKTDAVVVELGMGSFPNADFLAAGGESGPQRMDIIGLDPNDSMEVYARRAAKRAGLLEQGHSVRVVHGVGEALPLKTGSADAVVCTLTLCSVVDPERTLAEVRRVLKPGGKLLFWEHVLCETDSSLAMQQELTTPMQVVMGSSGVWR